MTAYLVVDDDKYIVRDASCIGRTCLNLGIAMVYQSILSFGKEPPMETLCCTKMVEKGCPGNYEKLFTLSLRYKRIKSGYSVRII